MQKNVPYGTKIESVIDMQDLFDYFVTPLTNLLEENVIDSEIYGYYAAVLAVALALIAVCFLFGCVYKILASIFAYDRGV